MRALLDTHALLWWITDDPRLSETARRAIAGGDNEILVSAASGWEIAIKGKLGRLPLPALPGAFISEQLRLNRFTALPVEMSHALHVHTLPDHHRDPFDRMLVAQCQVENVPLVTADADIARYDVRVIW
jgi:PIN domain nuclease of toxin-antitoxin system